MKSISFLFFICFFISFSNAQTSNWLWAKSGIGTNGVSEGYGVCSDASGNAFITGGFSSSSVTFGSTTLTGTGIANVYLVKYDPAGNVLWAKSAVGTGSDYGVSLGADANGNVFVAGYFDGSSITFGTTTLTSAGGVDIFLVKYDPNGNLLWAISAGGSSQDYVYSAATDTSGNIVITGSFAGSITFGTTTLSNSSFFVAKYDSNGNLAWANSAGNNYNGGSGRGLSIDKAGNIYVGGSFFGISIVFGTTTLNDSGSGYNDPFLVKYDPNGVVLWAKSILGSTDDVCEGASVDTAGNVVLIGWFRSPAITLGTHILTNTNHSGDTADVFIAKYDPSGNVIWAINPVGGNNDYGWSVSADNSGNVFVSGGFLSHNIKFGSVIITNLDSSNCPLYCDPMFIVKLDGNGNVLCSSALKSGADDLNGISADPFGNVYVGGDFGASPFIVGTDTLIVTSFEDPFIAKFRANCGVDAVDEIIADNDISIFPNPSSGIFNIKSTEKINSILIYDLLGNKIYESKTDLNEINISNTSPGIYFLQIETGKGIVARKIVKE